MQGKRGLIIGGMLVKTPPRYGRTCLARGRLHPSPYAARKFRSSRKNDALGSAWLIFCGDGDEATAPYVVFIQTYPGFAYRTGTSRFLEDLTEIEGVFIN